MKVGIGIGSAYYNGEDWQELAWRPTAWAWTMSGRLAWGMDAVVPLAYIAANQHIKLGNQQLAPACRR